jgi:hypothetical protein
MWSSRKSSVKRHIQNVHRGNSNLVSFIDYLAGRRSGFYFPCLSPTFDKSSTSANTETVMDTFKGEVWKAVATKAANKVLYPSTTPAVNQQQYISNFQGFGNFGAPYFYPNQFRHEPLHIIPRPEDIFGFEIYTCKKCSNIQAAIVSFNDGKEGGSRINWSSCCDFASFSDLKKVDQKDLNDNNELQQKVQNKLKYCIQTWTDNKFMLTAIRIPESFRGTSIKLLGEGNKQSISLEYSSGKNIELDIDDENHWASRCIRAGMSAISDDDLSDFLKKTEKATFAFFTVKVKEIRGIYLMAILNDIVHRRLRLVQLSSLVV